MRRGFDEATPVLDQLGRLTMNVEPGQRLLERPAMDQGAPRARREVGVHEPALQRQDLPKPLDIARAQRQHAERQSRLTATGATPARRRSTSGGVGRAAPHVVAHRHEQRSEQDRIGERLGQRLEAGAVGVDARPATSRDSSPACDCSSGAIGSSSLWPASIRNAFSAAPDRSSLYNSSIRRAGAARARS